MDAELLNKVKQAVQKSTGRRFVKTLLNAPEHFVALLGGNPPSSVKSKLHPLLAEIGQHAEVEEKKVVLLIAGKAHTCAYVSASFWYIPEDAKRIDEGQIVSLSIDPIGTLTIIAE
jgi:hypothetical protein